MQQVPSPSNDFSKDVLRYHDPEKKIIKPHQIIFNLSEN